MSKTTTSLLLATMMAFSGFAVAQTADVKSGTQGGAGPTGMSGNGDNGASVKSRAEVKADRMPQKSGIQGGEGANAGANPNTMNSGSSMHNGMAKTTAAERKAARDQRRADRKAARMSKTDASMGANSSAAGAVGNTTVQGGGMGATGRTLGQGQPSQKQGNSAN